MPDMDDDELRALLARVQTGELTPEQAAAQLQPEPDPPEPSQATPQESERATSFSGTRTVRLRATANRTRVIGDASVQTVSVSGPHRIRVEGDTVIVENDIGDEIFGDGARHIRIQSRARGRGGIRIQGLQGLQGIQGFRGHEVLEVRMNPALTLDFDCDAGTIEVHGVEGPLTGRINAGNAVVEDFNGPIHLSVNAGKLRASGRLDGGTSSVDVNVGKADVLLEEGSNVRIIRTATLGSAESDDDVVGTGSGTLRVTCSLGAARIHSPEGSLSFRHRA
jgi:hypothetical protein